MSVPALLLRGITRRFGAVLANDDASLEVAPGTIHALVGENGAGKSTLMKIAYGQVRADAGTIAIRGTDVPRAKHSPSRALELGLGMVHQHFMLVGPMTVTENSVLGREKRRGAWLDLAGPAAELRALSQRFGLEVDPGARVEALSVGQKQRAEILKVLHQGAQVLLLDEPTAVLTPGEARQLEEVLRGLVKQGKTVVLITHKLDEVCRVADRITVMRRGKVVEEMAGGADATPERIARAMVGRPVLFVVARGEATPKEIALEVERLSVPREGGGRDAVAGVSLAVRAGEIVGIAGVEGNGQSELFEAVAGLVRPSRGKVSLAGRDITGLPVRARQELGLGHVPEDRHHRGLVLDFSVEENLILGRQRAFGGWRGLDRARVRAEAERQIAAGDVRPADPRARTGGLSGGNQQKLVIARELGRPGLKVLLCAQPTRGVDIGAIEHIHKAIVAARDAGLAVLLVSAELPELRALADRLLVMVRGTIAAELSSAELRAEGALDRVGELMTGTGAAA
ncbi:MAG TPA: ABC transporter ATP-binding protein [Kofleriaceae bacterium]|nr:ABC transporter ATP-binding protein [Kofleriaceae bacterium]